AITTKAKDENKTSLTSNLLSFMDFDISMKAYAINGREILKAITDIKSTPPTTLNASPIANIAPDISKIVLIPSLILDFLSLSPDNNPLDFLLSLPILIRVS